MPVELSTQPCSSRPPRKAVSTEESARRVPEPFTRLERFAAAIAFLMKKPRTRAELAQLMDTSRTQNMSNYIDVLRAEGLIYISGWRETPTRPAAVYAWQPSVCCFQDVPYCSRKGS